jgi:putative ABC transport system permease protein
MTLRRELAKLGALFHRRKPGDDLAEEIRAHLEMEEQENLDRGMAPDEAHYAALRRFGNVTLAQERSREMWGWNSIESLGQDIRLGVRTLRKQPVFTIFAVLALGLGIGAMTSIFSVVDAVLLRPLPFREAGRLVLIKENVNKLGNASDLPAPDVLTFARESRAFEQVGGFERGSMELSGIGEPERIRTARLTAPVFQALGVSPMLGRTFSQSEDDHSERVLVISYALWRTRFHGDSQILGKRVDLDRQPYVIIGVMPRGFEFPLEPGRLSRAEMWVPMSFTPEEREDAGDNFQYGAVARLKPEVSQAQAEQDVNRVVRGIQAAYPASMDIQVTASLLPLKEDAVYRARPLVRLLFGAVMAVLLIACANLAGLLLVRGIRKQREIAVRKALGASNLALVRQSLMESLLISLAGGAVGVFLARAGLRSWVSLLPETLPRLDDIRLDGSVMVFALTATLVTGIICGLAPALFAMRSNTNEGLKGGGRTLGSGIGETRLRSLLVVTEVAAALVLLTVAGLLLRSYVRVRSVDPGFVPERVMIASYELPDMRYSKQQQVDNFHIELLRRLEQLPGVRSAALGSNLPLAEPNSDRFFVADGYQPPPGAAYSSEAQVYVVGDYLRTLEIPLLRGRSLGDADGADSPLAVVVSRTLAERYWPGQDPIGQRIKWGVDPSSTLPWMTVVGEVADTKQGPLESQDRNQVYQPLVQFPRSWGDADLARRVHGQNMRIAVRTSGDPELMENSIRRAVWSLDAQLAVSNMQTMEQAISESEGPRRFNTIVLSAFALGAVLLAALGIYGVIAYSAAQRAHEIAIRMALGAQRTWVFRLILGSGARLAMVGCALGLVGGAAATRLVQPLLFEVSPFDPAVFAIAATGVFILALVASFLPARRATQVDPMAALRNE